MLGALGKQMRRDKLTIMIEILNDVGEPIKKTHLLYKVGMNFHELDRYLKLLLSIGLVGTIKEPLAGYHITEKGRQFLDIFHSNSVDPRDRRFDVDTTACE